MLGPKSALHRWCLRSFHEFFVANINWTIDICIINVGKLPKTFIHSVQGNGICFCAECSRCCLNLGEQLVVVLYGIFGAIFSHEKLDDKMEELENFRKIVFGDDKNWSAQNSLECLFSALPQPYERMILLDWFNDGYATTYHFRHLDLGNLWSKNVVPAEREKCSFLLVTRAYIRVPICTYLVSRVFILDLKILEFCCTHL